MSGIDKLFDYLVPESMTLGVGDKVRVVLHGRRVGGWVVALSDQPPSGLEPARIVAIAARSGAGVAPDVVELSTWIAAHWFGPRRAVLASASAPRMRSGPVHPRKGRIAPSGSVDAVTEAVLSAARDGATNVVHMLRVPPLGSVLPAIAELAADAPVLVVCPTMRMAALGAAWLRRRGAEVAVLPDDWEAAAAGVDVVIGARSAVLAPCANVSAIVVIDAHDESLKEERSPTWDALSVARERGARLGVPVIAASAVPPAVVDHVQHVPIQAPVVHDSRSGWGRIVVENLSELPVSGSLLGAELLQAVRQPGAGVLCILNTKGAVRLLACRSCRQVQKCAVCQSALTRSDTEMSCERCDTTHGSVCVSCGATTLTALRSGTAGLLAEIEKSTGIRGVEVNADSAVDSLVGGVFIGTESLLNRVRHADTVVFCDIDRDLSAPRITAPREVLALVAKAVRIAGSDGTVVVQSRDPSHPVLGAIVADDVDDAITGLLAADIDTRRELDLPPFSVVVRVSGFEHFDDKWLAGLTGLDHRRHDGVVTLRARDTATVSAAIEAIAAASRAPLRVHADPMRY